MPHSSADDERQILNLLSEFPRIVDRNECQRRPEGWRIVRRDARWDLFMGDPSVLFDA